MTIGELLWMMLWPIVLYDSITVLIGMLLPQAGILMVQAAAALAAAAVLGILFGRAQREGRLWPGKRNSCSRPGKALCFFCVMLGIASCLFLNLLIAMSGIKDLFPGYQQTSQELFAPSLGLQAVAMGVLIPVTEELIFRGFLYGVWRKRYSFAVAAAVSAVWFGLYHGSVVQGLYAAAMGVILAWIYECSGEFLAPILVHSISNLTSVVTERYHLDGVNWSEIPFFLVMSVSGIVMVWLLIRIRKANLKEDV